MTNGKSPLISAIENSSALTHNGCATNLTSDSAIVDLFFNIAAMEMLAKQFGMQVMPSAIELRNKKEDVPLVNLIMNGRNLSLEQYFEVKEELE